MAIGCRVLISGLLVGAYQIKRAMNQHALRKKQKKHLLHQFNSLILLVCCVTVATQLFFLQFRFTYYAAALIALSLLVALDEYEEIVWLWQREVARRAATLEPQQGEKGEEERQTLYARLFLLLYCKVGRYAPENSPVATEKCTSVAIEV